MRGNAGRGVPSFCSNGALFFIVLCGRDKKHKPCSQRFDNVDLGAALCSFSVWVDRVMQFLTEIW